jgi:3-deoxy-D-manno-octulosonic-acid transferase
MVTIPVDTVRGAGRRGSPWSRPPPPPRLRAEAALYRCADEITSLALSPLIVLHLLQRRMRGLERELGPRLGLPALWGDVARPVARPGPRRPIWLHGSSVGESLSALALATHLAERGAGLDFLISSGTVDGVDVVRKRLERAGAVLPGARVACVQAPADLPFAVWAFRRRWQPSALIVLEADLWPSMLAQCAQSGIPLALVDGRMSERSAARWGSWLLRPLIAYLLSRFEIMLCQSAGDAGRLRALGGAQARCLGSIKSIAGPLPVDNAAVQAVRGALRRHDALAAASACGERRQRRVWLAASTHNQEEELVAQAHAQVLAAGPGPSGAHDLGAGGGQQGGERPLLVIIPRHPRRCARVIDMLASQHPSWCVQLHSKMTSFSSLASADVLVVDALGVMGTWYSIADVALVGGSLVEGVGGHNVMEAALLGCVPLHGPFNENGQHLIDGLRAFDPTCIQQVSSPTQLASAVIAVLRSVGDGDTETAPLQRAALAAAQHVSTRTCAQLAESVAEVVLKKQKVQSVYRR